jgi:aldehyde dehydrogenase (NAD+)
MILTLQPLYGAISAGCCAVIKTSEYAPNYSNLLSRLVSQYLDTSAYQVVQGSVPEVTKLLELQCMFTVILVVFITNVYL